MRVEDLYKKDASAGKFKKFGVEVQITVTADHLNDEKELIEVCQRLREAVETEVSEVEEDLMEEATADD